MTAREVLLGPRAPAGVPAVRPLRASMEDRAIWGHLVTAVVTLVAVTASVTLAIGQWSLPPQVFDDLVSANHADLPVRAALVRNVGIAVAAVLGVASIYLAVRRRKGVGELARFAACISPFTVAFALPSLLAYRLWFDKPLKHLTFLAVVVLAFEWTMRRATAAFPDRFGVDRLASLLPETLRRALPLCLVLLGAAGYSAYAAYYSVLEHWRFATGGYDLGIYDSLLANMLAGKPFRSPVCTPNMSYLSNHAEFGIFFMTPVYALFPRAETLLVAQAIFLGFAAVPLYLFASTQVTRGTALLLAFAYLLFAPMHGANFYDFHWMPMAIPLWLSLFYALARRKTWLVVTLLCFILPLREETGVMLAVLGAFLVLSSYWPRLGLVFCVLGSTWFTVMRFVVIPLSGTWWFENMYAALIAPGEAGYGSVVKTLLINPAYVWKTLVTEPKFIYLLHLLAPLAFLPLRKPLLAMLAVPGSFFTLLTTDYEHTLSIRFQYTSHWIPWIFGSTVLYLMLKSAAPDGAARRRAAIAAVVFGVFCHSYVYGAVLQHHTFIGGFERVPFGITESERIRYRDFKALAAKIPKKASVAASEDIVAHVSNRPNAYTLKVTNGSAEYLLLRASSLNGADRSHAEEAFSTYMYGLVGSTGDFYLFQRDVDSPETDAALKKLRIHSR